MEHRNPVMATHPHPAPIPSNSPAPLAETEGTQQRRRGGRPSRDEAGLLGEKILTIATQIFLTEGYGATSIETIARRAGISKRTFYHRFPNKSALFEAVVHRIVQSLRPPDNAALASLFEGASLDEILGRLAQVLLRATMRPEALALYRVIIAEAGRFPELAATVGRRSAREEGVKLIAALLERMQPGATPGAARFAAIQFMSMVVNEPQRTALGLGAPMSEAELEAWAKDAVRLFLEGFKSSSGRSA